MNLPSAFEEKMKYLLGAEYSDFASLHAKEMKSWANNYKKGLKI